MTKITDEDLDDLDDVIVSGVHEVWNGEDRVKYQSAEALLKVRDRISELKIGASKPSGSIQATYVRR